MEEEPEAGNQKDKLPDCGTHVLNRLQTLRKDHETATEVLSHDLFFIHNTYQNHDRYLHMFSDVLLPYLSVLREF